MATSGTGPTRRERNMRDKRERIFRAADELFTERGFDATSTPEIAERADVGAGTLFRYASSKAELLLMVANAQLTELVEHATRSTEPAEDAIDDPVEAILDIALPALERALVRPDNAAAYQRELLFGASNERYRLEGLALFARLEARFVEILRGQARGRGLVDDSDAAAQAASAIIGAAVLVVARTSTGAHPGRDAATDLRTQVAQIVTGHLTLLERAAAAPELPRANVAGSAAPDPRGDHLRPRTPAHPKGTSR